MRLPIAEPYVAVPVNLQIREVVVVERLPRHVPSDVWCRISVSKSIQAALSVLLHHGKLALQNMHNVSL